MDREVEGEDVARCVRFRSNSILPAGAQLVRPRAHWNDLVLPPKSLAQLDEIVTRVRLRERVFDAWGFLEGRVGASGVRAMFTGAPGTGKTLAAEAVADRLGLDLLVVDLGRVVSKWLGESERNITTILEDAERRQVVLLFDEADALFGRRTEIGDAHDRWANLETSHLLSKIERFEGLVILSTNLRQNIDPAFQRRLEFVVEFPEPSALEREALWRTHIPERAPLHSTVDLREIAARYPIVGAWIRNAAVSAAFLAAASDGTITQQHLVAATQREYEKSGRAYPGDPPPKART
jgi:SpoVK/Ycf46/Vps4 family AAA+-type ATPase